MTSEITVAEFFEAYQQTEHALDLYQLQPLKTALENHSAPIGPLAAQIARPILEANARNPGTLDPNFKYYALWRSLASVIKQMPCQTDRVVDLVIALHSVPDDRQGYLAFGQDMREEWREFAATFRVPTVSTDAGTKRRAREGWININAFNAKLSARRIEGLDQRGFAGNVFYTALEETPWEVMHVEWIEKSMDEDGDDREDPNVIVWRDAELAKRDVRILNYWVPAAAAWIEHDGKGIYDMEGPIRKNDDEPSVWKGPDTFSKERFRLWRERFAWASRVTALEHDTRRRAAKAAETMQRVIEGDEGVA